MAINLLKIPIKKLFKQKRRPKSLVTSNSYYSDLAEFHGNPKYGGWSICKCNLTRESIVYSFGVGEDISFDLSVIATYGLRVFAFDPTPRSIEWLNHQKLPREFKFYPFGIAGHDGTVKFYPPENTNHVSHSIIPKNEKTFKPIEVRVKRLSSIMQNFNHSFIDILKMDIEGAEYDVINDLVNMKDICVKQVLVEFHHRFDGIRKRDTEASINKMLNFGYKLFNISRSEQEYTFILEK
jgi:FkbM family methyltransferase